MQNSRILSGIPGFREFAEIIGLSEDESKQREDALERSYMPFQCSTHYANLIAEQAEPYRSQLINIVLPPIGRGRYRGRFDPYGNISYKSEEHIFLQHKYRNTLLLHFIDVCLANCQFCYKVNEIRIENSSQAHTSLKVQAALRHADANPDVNNILFTGGDPAVVKASVLSRAIRRLLEHPRIRFVRFATKAMAFDPARFLHPTFLELCEEVDATPGKQIVMINQINHPAEIGDKAAYVLKELVRRGVQMRGQPAVVKGVNDSVETLVALQRTFMDHNIGSYYLTTFMPVRGVEQYGLTLEDVWARVAESKRNLNGLEKKGVLLASHDFGKFEIVGFAPSIRHPNKIVLKWHQAAMPQYLPDRLKTLVPHDPEDVLVLDFVPGQMYSIDHVFAHNGLPYYTPDGVLYGADPTSNEYPRPAALSQLPVKEPV